MIINEVSNISVGAVISVRGFILDRLIPNILGVLTVYLTLLFFEQLALCHGNLLGVAGVAAFRPVVKSDRVPFEHSGV